MRAVCMTRNIVTTSLVSIDRESLVVVGRVSLNDDSLVVAADFKKKKIIGTEWGEGNKVSELIDENRKKSEGSDDLPEPPRVRDRIKSFTLAQFSVRASGPISRDALNYRFCCCHGETLEGVKVRSEPCRAREITESGKRLCKPCGCPEWEIASLDVDLEAIKKTPAERGIFAAYSKLECPKLKCPLDYFDESPGIKEQSHGD